MLAVKALAALFAFFQYVLKLAGGELAGVGLLQKCQARAHGLIRASISEALHCLFDHPLHVTTEGNTHSLCSNDSIPRAWPKHVGTYPICAKPNVCPICWLRAMRRC